jgi:hypothetical protein
MDNCGHLSDEAFYERAGHHEGFAEGAPLFLADVLELYVVLQKYADINYHGEPDEARAALERINKKYGVQE